MKRTAKNSTGSPPADLIERGEGRFALAGELNFATVPALLKDAERRFAGHRDIVVDLAGVSATNSAGMALLLEWRARARDDGIALQFLHLPETLRQIAQVCEVERLLAGGDD